VFAKPRVHIKLRKDPLMDLRSFASGSRRLCNSIFVAVCVAPLLLLGMCFMVGWNEKRAVCDQKAILAGMDAVQEIGCSNPFEGDGSLVMMSCQIAKDGLEALTLPDTDFSEFSHIGTGLRVVSRMYQCVEHEKKVTRKLQGGGEETIHTYTYRKEWVDGPVDSRRFHSAGFADFRRNCGAVQNPPWPSRVPRSHSYYAPSMKVGAVTTDKTSSVPLKTPLTNVQTPPGWTKTGSDIFASSKWRSSNLDEIGDVETTFYSNDWANAKATLLGENNGGRVGKWKAPSSWLCDGSTLSDLRMGTHGKEKLFTELKDESNALTWLIRILGFALIWLAFSLFFGPLGVMGDCIPCIGPMVGDSIEAVTCCVSCLPATACTLGVAGVVWVAMRPLVGAPLILVFVFVMGSAIAYVAKRNGEKSVPLIGGQPRPSQPAYGAAQAAPAGQPMFTAPAPVLAQPVQAQPGPVQAQPRQMQVLVPAGSGPGSAVQVQTPEGTLLQATVPEGVPAGGAFTISY